MYREETEKTPELLGFKWQRESYDEYWFIRAIYVLLSYLVSTLNHFKDLSQPLYSQ